MLTAIANYLTALLQLLKQKHLTAKDYQGHLLYERLQNGIDADIDRVKEIALACGYSDYIANAKLSFQNAASILTEITDGVELEFATINQINQTIKKINEDNEKILLNDVFNEGTAKEAIVNMLGDIAEKRTRDIYLLRFEK